MRSWKLSFLGTIKLSISTLRMLEQVEIFPKEDVGLYSNLIQRFDFVMVNQNEPVYYKGETAEEIFFIIEGIVAIVDDNDKKIVELKRGDFFGEMAIIDGNIGIRSVSYYSD
jgi:CRP-like cAMP-binding protein